MTKTSFNLLTGASGPIEQGPEPRTVYVPLAGHDTKTVKKKAPVAAGTVVAEHPAPGRAFAHSPIEGAVGNVSEDYVEITAGLPAPKKEGEEPPRPDPVEKVDLGGLSGADLEKALNALGIETRGLKKPILVVNGLNPEPGVSVHEHLLAEEKATLEAGLALVKDFLSPTTVHFVVASGSGAELTGAVGVQVKPEYPASVEELAVKAATGREMPDDVAHLSLLELWRFGRAAETGLPVTETVTTVGGKDFKVKIGTPVGEVLAKAGIQLEECDKVVLGGPMRGEALDSPDKPVRAGDYGLFVIPFGAFPPVTDRQCLNCGECVLKCPSRIRPNMITRYAEFKMFEMARQWGLEYCIECGLCAFYCTGRRPLLQLIRLAKTQLGVQMEEVGACFLVAEQQEREAEQRKEEAEQQA